MIEVTVNENTVEVEVSSNTVEVQVSNAPLSGGGGSWGTITGILADQTDLQSVLDGKVDESTELSINGTAYDLSANRSWSVGTVTSVGITGGTGISVSGSPITGNGSITVTNSAPDQVVSLSQSGTTTVSGTYPNFTISSADQYTGTVTSVGLTSSTGGVTITGSPVTGNGSLNFEIATASGSATGLLSSTDWSTFNGKQNALVSGTNIKSINNESLLGSGNINVNIVASNLFNYYNFI